METGQQVTLRWPVRFSRKSSGLKINKSFLNYKEKLYTRVYKTIELLELSQILGLVAQTLCLFYNPYARITNAKWILLNI